MKFAYYIILFNCILSFSQKSIEIRFIKQHRLDNAQLVSIDNFGTIYYSKNNVFSKINKEKTITYSNLQLGNLQSANTFNPLKINLFYKDLNTIIILDNRLSEIYKIDFNTISNYKNVTHISTGYDNTIWIFNQDLQQLELYDYKANKVKVQCIPIQSDVLDLKSNFNTCWLLTKHNLFIYNYFGSLIKKIPNAGFSNIEISNGNTILKKGNSLFYFEKEENSFSPIALPNILINQFFVTDETLYIYNNDILQQFQLKTF